MNFNEILDLIVIKNLHNLSFYPTKYKFLHYV